MTVKKIKFNDIEKMDIVNVKGGLTVKQIKEKYNPDVFCNLALYAFDGNQNITYLVDENTLDGYLFSNEGIGIKNRTELVWTDKDTAFNSKEIIDWVAGSPTLVKDGKPYINWGNKVGSHNNGSHYRMCIGFDKNSVTLFGSDNKLSIAQSSSEMVNLGCSHAINCDGGGSVHLEDKTKIHKSSSRANASWFMIWLKKPKEEVKMKKLVVLDPGHSKNTAGKRSPDGSLMEYDFNRKVSRRIKHHLDRHDVDVIYSCDIETPVDISLSERCKTANNVKADLFVSIHANALGDKWCDANGWEIYVLSLGGNAEKLAKAIEKESNPYLGLKNRGLKTANFQVLRDTKMPAVLVEHAFMDNQKECELMKTEQFQEKCAIADSKGILKHLGIKWKDEDKVNDDNQQPSDWANSAWAWSVENKLCDGKDPKSIPTKEQIMCYFKRFEDYIIKNK